MQGGVSHLWLRGSKSGALFPLAQFVLSADTISLMTVAIFLLSKSTVTVFALEGLFLPMDADVVHNVAKLEERCPALQAVEDLIEPPSRIASHVKLLIAFLVIHLLVKLAEKRFRELRSICPLFLSFCDVESLDEVVWLLSRLQVLLLAHGFFVLRAEQSPVICNIFQLLLRHVALATSTLASFTLLRKNTLASCSVLLLKIR